MKFQNKLKLVAAFVTGVAALSAVQAADVSVDASVVVNNTIDVTVNSPLDFGSIAAFANNNATAALATLTIPADPAGTPTATNDATGTARIIVLSPGSAADVSVAGAAPNTLLTVTVAAATTTLDDPANIAPDGFTMGSFTQFAYLEGNGQSFGTTTDGTGALGMSIGGTLSTVTPTGGAAGTDVAVAYTDATYVGSLEVTVNY